MSLKLKPHVSHHYDSLIRFHLIIFLPIKDQVLDIVSGRQTKHFLNKLFPRLIDMCETVDCFSYQVCLHLQVCSNLSLLLELENYSADSDYHSPVQQPCFSGALKVTRVEQMAQFPQSFRINESLLQRNANFQTLDCFLKQD